MLTLDAAVDEIENMSEDELNEILSYSSEQPLATIDKNRVIHIPDELKKLGYKNDSNMKYIQFMTSVFWDLENIGEQPVNSQKTRINYIIEWERSDGYRGKDEAYDNFGYGVGGKRIDIFSWKVPDKLFEVSGTVKIVITAIGTDIDTYKTVYKFSTETNEEMYISENNSEDDIEDLIVIDSNRIVHVPEKLKRIGVEGDHNIEEITFSIPRYWDGNDLYKGTPYVNYMRSDGEKGSCPFSKMSDSTLEPDRFIFSIDISGNMTKVKGPLAFIVCIRHTDKNGDIDWHWNSELNKEMYISEGLECDLEDLEVKYPDLYTSLLQYMDETKNYLDEKHKQTEELVEQAKKYAVKGDRGSKWTVGTALTGENTVETVFPDSGLEDSMETDHYLNPETGNIYVCTVKGDANTAKWVYSGNIKSAEIVKETYPEFSSIQNCIFIKNGEYVDPTDDSIPNCADIAYGQLWSGEKYYVAVGEGGILTSKDGNEWTIIDDEVMLYNSFTGSTEESIILTPISDMIFYQVVYHNHCFYAVGEVINANANRFILASKDCVNWSLPNGEDGIYYGSIFPMEGLREIIEVDDYNNGYPFYVRSFNNSAEADTKITAVRTTVNATIRNYSSHDISDYNNIIFIKNIGIYFVVIFDNGKICRVKHSDFLEDLYNIFTKNQELEYSEIDTVYDSLKNNNLGSISDYFITSCISGHVYDENWLGLISSSLDFIYYLNPISGVFQTMSIGGLKFEKALFSLGFITLITSDNKIYAFYMHYSTIINKDGTPKYNWEIGSNDVYFKDYSFRDICCDRDEDTLDFVMALANGNDSKYIPFKLLLKTEEKPLSKVVNEMLIESTAGRNHIKSLEDFFQKVANGKILIASAITDKGVNTTSDAEYEVMANNIRQIKGKGESYCGKVTVKESVDSLQKYTVPSGGYSYMVSTGFAELAELMGLNYDPNTKVMYKNDKDYGILFMQTGATSFGITSSPGVSSVLSNNSQSGLSYTVTGIDVGDEIEFIKGSNVTLVGYRRSSDFRNTNIHWCFINAYSVDSDEEVSTLTIFDSSGKNIASISENGDLLITAKLEGSHLDSVDGNDVIQMWPAYSLDGTHYFKEYFCTNSLLSFADGGSTGTDYAFEFTKDGVDYILINNEDNYNYSSQVIRLN